MIAGIHCRFWIFASMLTLGLVSVMPVRAANDDMVGSPRYAVWAKFKPESSATVSSDMAAGPGNSIHIVMTTTLKSVTADKVDVERVTKVSFMGHESTRPAASESFPAKAAKQPMKETGEKDIEAMGKTFKCKVYELTGESAAAMAPNPRGGAAPTGAGAQGKATLYVSDDVPGGVVKMEITGVNGQVMTFTLTAMDAK